MDGILDLSSEDFRLYENSGPSAVVHVPSSHRPVLQQASQRWDDVDEDEQAYHYLRVSRFRNKHPILVLDVPPKLYNSIAPIQSGLQQRYRAAQRNEFSHLRYTPVTCDPREFIQEGYLLQHQLFVKPRPVEICVGITMYNEDELSLGKTLNAVHRNIRYLQGPFLSSPWGPDAWRKVIVCIISDGRSKIHRKTQAMLAALGLYQDIAMMRQDEHTGRDVTMHMFEYTTHSSIRLHEQQISVALGAADAVFCQTIFCLKEKNQKRANSQRWFMQAICEAVTPAVCVTLDAGSIPNDNALYDLWRPFRTNKSIASTTTFSNPEVFPKNQPIKNPFVAYQQFEYAMNNCLYQPVDSLFGRRYAMNLGNIAAYRWPIVTNEATGRAEVNLFPSETYGATIPSMFRNNQVLIEDRAISSSLMRTGKPAWRTVAVNAAQVLVDVPQTLGELTQQRRRFLNGHFFASIWELAPSHVLRPAPGRIYILALLRFFAGAVYQLVMLGLDFFAIGTSFAVFCVVTASLRHAIYLGSAGETLADVTLYVYPACFFTGLAYCMGSRPQRTPAFGVLAAMWALIYCYFLAVIVYLVVVGAQEILRLSDQSAVTLLSGQLFTCLVWPLLAIVVVSILAPLTLLQLPPNIFACIWYPLLVPMYTNLIHTYAWCNLHDFTWGWKGDARAEILPSVQVRGGPGNGETVRTVQDPSTGDMIFYGYDEYLNQLDAMFDEYRSQCEYQSPDAPYSHSAMDKFEDQLKDYRTRTLLCWLFLNSLLVMFVANSSSVSRFTPTADGGKGLIFVGVVLWAHAGLRLFQYCCTVIFAMTTLVAFLVHRIRPERTSSMEKASSQTSPSQEAVYQRTPSDDVEFVYHQPSSSQQNGYQRTPYDDVPVVYHQPSSQYAPPEPPPLPSSSSLDDYYNTPVGEAYSPYQHVQPTDPYPPYPMADRYEQATPAGYPPRWEPAANMYR